MKLAGQLLIAFGLAFGAFAASTLYHVDVNDISPADIESGLTLNEPVKTKDKTEIAKKNDKITAAVKDKLVAAGIPFVRVKEFSFSRWQWSWLFAVSLVGMGAGAWLLKRSAAEVATSEDEKADASTSPAGALEATDKELESLLGRVEEVEQTADRLQLIVGGVEELQQTHLAAFVDARDRLTAQYGIGGMAELMDGFAAAERSINRAWSAASDGHLDEAMSSLKAARPLLEGPLAKLQAD